MSSFLHYLVIIINDLLQVTTDESKRIRENTDDKRLGVKYGPGDCDIVDIYGEKGNRSSQVMVYLSGGYWQELSGEISSYTVQPLLSGGHTVVVGHYTRCPGQDMEAIVDQVTRLVRWTLEDYARPRHLSLVLSGHSAGSHLCAMVLTSDWFRSLSPEDAGLLTGVVHLSGTLLVIELK